MRSGTWVSFVLLSTVATLVTGVVLWLAFPYLVGPPVPRKISIATGTAAGVYHATGHRYRKVLADSGIELEVIDSAGSVENLELLNSGKVTLAIVQGGAAAGGEHDRLKSLASLYLEPVWLFYRSEVGPIQYLDDLIGKRIAIGPQGSGTRAIATSWLRANQMLQEGPSSPATTLLPLTGQEAADALIAGDIDAVCLVIGAEADVVTQLTGTDGIELMDFQRAPAYRTRYRYLKAVTLTEGMLALDQDLPGSDVHMLAATACLVAREDIHPALIPLVLGAATEVHEDGGFFEAPREFPSPLDVELPIHPDARRYFRDGPSFLYRYLPFRFASWLDRMKLLLAPMVMLLLPLVKLFPPVYRFRIRSRIYRWYRELRKIDQKLQENSAVDFSDDIKRLDSLQTELAEVSVPLSYMEEFYNLRLHVKYVVDLLSERQAQHENDGASK